MFFDDEPLSSFDTMELESFRIKHNEYKECQAGRLNAGAENIGDFVVLLGGIWEESADETEWSDDGAKWSVDGTKWSVPAGCNCQKTVMEYIERHRKFVAEINETVRSLHERAIEAEVQKICMGECNLYATTGRFQ